MIEILHGVKRYNTIVLKKPEKRMIQIRGFINITLKRKKFSESKSIE